MIPMALAQNPTNSDTKKMSINQIDEQEIFSGNDAFGSALLDPDIAVPKGIIGPDGKDAPKRFSVYRNNVVLSLMEAMGETYPGVRNIIGEENFAILARNFIAAHPPSSPMMQAYGDLFPKFIKQFKPLQQFPFLTDVAMVEKKWIEAYHARDTIPLDPASLSAINPDDLMQIRFQPHPATHLVLSSFELFELFCLRKEENLANRANLSYEKSQSVRAVLITRPHLVVEVKNLDQASTEFVKLILDQKSLGQAVESAMGISIEFNPSKAIAMMLSSGMLEKLIAE